MERETYKLSDELISAKEARTKLDAIRSGLLLNTQMLNKRIKEAVGAGVEGLTLQDPPEEILYMLSEKLYVLEELGDGKWKVTF
jgi:hypothetical protein